MPLAHPSSLPSPSGDTVMAAGCVLKYLQSYHLCSFKTLRTSHTTLSPAKALCSVEVLLHELQLHSCQVPAAGNWDIHGNMGCVPDCCFCGALVSLQLNQQGPSEDELSQQLPRVLSWQAHPNAIWTLLLPQSPRQQCRAQSLTGPAIYGFSFHALIMSCWRY